MRTLYSGTTVAPQRPLRLTSLCQLCARTLGTCRTRRRLFLACQDGGAVVVVLECKQFKDQSEGVAA